MITFVISKRDGFVHIVSTGDTYPEKEALKSMGFRWNCGAWRAIRAADDQEDCDACGAWLESLIRAYPGHDWECPNWLQEAVDDVRCDEMRTSLPRGEETPLMDLFESLDNPLASAALSRCR